MGSRLFPPTASSRPPASPSRGGAGAGGPDGDIPSVDLRGVRGMEVPQDAEESTNITYPFPVSSLKEKKENGRE